MRSIQCGEEHGIDAHSPSEIESFCECKPQNLNAGNNRPTLQMHAYLDIYTLIKQNNFARLYVGGRGD